MKLRLAGVAGLLACAPASAQTIAVVPTLAARLRYEHAEQADLPRSADALTLRLRPALAASRGGWSALLEAEAVVAPVARYNDALNGRAGYPAIPDPENLELNRAQLRYAAPGAAGTLGRQRVALADERFVGTAPWRQSEQTFDAARLQLGRTRGPSLDLTHAWRVRTVYGRQGTGGRPTRIPGGNTFALLGYGTDWGTVAAFAYVVDQDDPAVQAGRLSSRTLGARATAHATIGGGAVLAVAGASARQTDHGDNPNDYAAHYRMAEASVTRRALALTAGLEVLGAAGGGAAGLPFTSVQTPLASAFKFNGWAGKFVTTPPDGLRDAYGAVGYGWKRAGPFDAVALSAAYHRFRSDRQSRPYGDEIDLLATVRRGRYALSARFAHYYARRFAADTDRGWLQLDWAI